MCVYAQWQLRLGDKYWYKGYDNNYDTLVKDSSCFAIWFFQLRPSTQILSVLFSVRHESEEVRHACTNHYKFSALMSLRSRDNVQAKCTELVVICARMSDFLWA